MFSVSLWARGKGVGVIAASILSEKQMSILTENNSVVILNGRVETMQLLHYAILLARIYIVH